MDDPWGGPMERIQRVIVTSGPTRGGVKEQRREENTFRKLGCIRFICFDAEVIGTLLSKSTQM